MAFEIAKNRAALLVGCAPATDPTSHWNSGPCHAARPPTASTQITNLSNITTKSNNQETPLHNALRRLANDRGGTESGNRQPTTDTRPPAHDSTSRPNPINPYRSRMSGFELPGMTRPRGSSAASDDSAGTVREQELGSMYDYLAKIILVGPSGTGK